MRPALLALSLLCIPMAALAWDYWFHHVPGVLSLAERFGEGRSFSDLEVRRLYNCLLHQAPAAEVLWRAQQQSDDVCDWAYRMSHYRAEVRQYARERGPFLSHLIVAIRDLWKYGRWRGPTWDDLFARHVRKHANSGGSGSGSGSDSDATVAATAAATPFNRTAACAYILESSLRSDKSWNEWLGADPDDLFCLTPAQLAVHVDRTSQLAAQLIAANLAETVTPVLSSPPAATTATATPTAPTAAAAAAGTTASRSSSSGGVPHKIVLSLSEPLPFAVRYLNLHYIVVPAAAIAKGLVRPPTASTTVPRGAGTHVAMLPVRAQPGVKPEDSQAVLNGARDNTEWEAPIIALHTGDQLDYQFSYALQRGSEHPADCEIPPQVYRIDLSRAAPRAAVPASSAACALSFKHEVSPARLRIVLPPQPESRPPGSPEPPP